jgi:hypothetical protein
LVRTLYSWADDSQIVPGIKLNGSSLATRVNQWVLSNTRVVSLPSSRLTGEYAPAPGSAPPAQLRRDPTHSSTFLILIVPHATLDRRAWSGVEFERLTIP